jgi:hypothetical protein
MTLGLQDESDIRDVALLFLNNLYGAKPNFPLVHLRPIVMLSPGWPQFGNRKLDCGIDDRNISGK